MLATVLAPIQLFGVPSTLPSPTPITPTTWPIVEPFADTTNSSMQRLGSTNQKDAIVETMIHLVTTMAASC